MVLIELRANNPQRSKSKLQIVSCQVFNFAGSTDLLIKECALMSFSCAATDGSAAASHKRADRENAEL